MHVQPAEIERLRQLGEASGQDLLGAIVASFRTSAPEIVSRLELELERGGDDEARHLSHTLRGSAATFGAAGLAELCRQVNLKVHEGDPEGARKLLPTLRDALDGVLAELAAALEDGA